MTFMTFGLEDRNIVVTGAAQGIGADIAYRLITNEHANVIAVDKQPFSGSELEQLLRNTDGNPISPSSPRLKYERLDASDRASVGNSFNILIGLRVGMWDGTVHGLVNNAGLLGLDTVRDMEQWDRYMNAHAKTAYVMTEVCYPLMKEGGSIVNMGSIELEMCAKDAVLYTAGKGAVLGLTIGYAVTLADKGIRVNMVSPGNVNTKDNVEQYQKDPKLKEVIDKFEFRTPMKRSVEPKEVANEVLFLLSDLSSGTTGQNRIVDCGYTRALWDNAWIKE